MGNRELGFFFFLFFFCLFFISLFSSGECAKGEVGGEMGGENGGGRRARRKIWVLFGLDLPLISLYEVYEGMTGEGDDRNP